MKTTKVLRAAILLIMAMTLGGCGESGDTPYLEFLGGGFVFNYRIGEAYYGFVVKTRRRLPDGSVIEASFEDPAGGKPFIVVQSAASGRAEYSFRSPGLRGVKKDRPYTVVVRLRRSKQGPVIAQYSRNFRSSVSQGMLPEVVPRAEGSCNRDKAERRLAKCISAR